MTCQRCGDCCRNNGLIPPAGIDNDAPSWMRTLVHNLVTNFAYVDDEGEIPARYHCVFLTDDRRCAVQDVYKPKVCRDFLCDKAIDAGEAAEVE